MINPRYLERIISDLRKEDAILIVEGNRDTDALTKVGIKKESVIESAQKKNSNIERDIIREEKTVIPLFDNDHSGMARMKRFIEYFTGCGIRIDLSYSRKLKAAGITYIEEIDNALSY